jgi:DNA-binding transcriptional LysR family regulator
MDDRLDTLALFARVVETASLTAAAREHGLSLPAASRRITALEARLGARLLVRTTRRTTPTEAGLAFHARARAILAELAEAEAAAAGLDAAPQGTLLVALPLLLGRAVLGPALFGFLAAHPKVRIEARYADRLVAVAEEGFDVAVRVGALSDSALIARRLAGFRRVLVAAPAYLAARGVPAHPAQLPAHDCLVFGALGATWRFAEPASGSEAVVRVTGPFAADTADAVLEAAEAALGIALSPSWQVARALAEGRLVRILENFEPPETPIHALWPPARRSSAKVRAFVDHLASFVAAHPGFRPLG